MFRELQTSCLGLVSVSSFYVIPSAEETNVTLCQQAYRCVLKVADFKDATGNLFWECILNPFLSFHFSSLPLSFILLSPSFFFSAKLGGPGSTVRRKLLQCGLGWSPEQKHILVYVEQWSASTGRKYPSISVEHNLEIQARWCVQILRSTWYFYENLSAGELAAKAINMLPAWSGILCREY